MVWLLIRHFWWLILLLYTPFAIAMYRIFKRADRPGWRGIIPILNVFLLWPLAGQQHLLKYTVICWLLVIVFSYLEIRILALLAELGSTVLLFIMNYSLAQNFGWKKSSACLFALSTGIGYFVLGYFNDKYIGFTGEAHFSQESINNTSVHIDNPNGTIQNNVGFINQQVNPRLNGMNGVGVNLSTANVNNNFNGNYINRNNVSANVNGNNIGGNSVNMNNQSINGLGQVNTISTSMNNN